LPDTPGCADAVGWVLITSMLRYAFTETEE
jgi:hypothetical protein